MKDFEKIYRQYFADVYRYILRLSGDEHIAEEITSRTFFKALRKIDSFRGDCDVKVWLCQIGKNEYYSYLKRNKKNASLSHEELISIPDVTENIDDRIISKDDAGRIRMILHEIPEPYKEVFMWRVYGELSFRQIGNIFSKTENWACVTYHRARKMIRQRMEEENE
ncbi:MAG: RNA polymerase sigma factor [Eubacteriaceae bacterium]|nr:RNA polymerase sigma factor [Eubacteriaceae bacterium]